MGARGGRSPALRATTLLVYVFLYAPIAVLVAFSFNRSRLSARWLGFTTEWYRSLWHNELIFNSLSNSLAVAVIVTLISVVFGTLTALGLARGRVKGRALVDGLIYLPLVIPEIVVAVALVIFFSLVRIRLSLTTIVIAHVTFCISYAIIVVGARLASADPSMEEAALDLGANERQAFLRVTLPIAAPAVLSAALLVFTTSFDDYLITSFVAGVKSTTLPLEIYSMLKRGITPEINAVSAAILLATIPLVYIAERLERGAMRVRTGLGIAGAVFLLMAVPLAGRGWRAGSGVPQLNIYCWSTYISPRVIHGFEQEYHCKVNYDLYDSNEALLAKLQGGNVDYDIVVPSDYMVQILSQQQLLAPLDKRKLPNVWANADRRFLGLPFDPANEYSVPYAWGTTGVAYRSDLVRGPVDSWDVFFDPRYSGHILLLDDMREAFGMALKKLGYSLNSTNPEEIRRARDLLLRQKPLVKGYNSSNFEEDLMAADAWIAQAYNGNLTFAIRDEPRIRYVIPKEGCTISVDSAAIPRNAPHKALALEFLNYFHRPEVNAKFINDCGFNSPNRFSASQVEPWIRDEPAIFPAPASLIHCEFMRDLGPVTALYDRYWTEIKAQ
ncbi:MAG: spermidine/putrescine ABC transporter permease [Acidobacteria bacterium]|nr:MAG: spermidine/putrescine ABC transporter permease [Acidobacteriota bacterium]